MYFVYILKCADNSFYVGYTSDLTRRIEEHKNEHGGTYTKIRIPVELAYREEIKTEYEAKIRERQLKGWSRKKKQALIDGNKELLIQLSKSKTI
jgi:putative endonuclease